MLLNNANQISNIIDNKNIYKKNVKIKLNCYFNVIVLKDLVIILCKYYVIRCFYFY